MEPSYLGERVAPVVIGALIALAGSYVLQVIVVPWVDAKKRRAQRWEDDVHAMGEFLTFDLPRAVAALHRELNSLALVQAKPESARSSLITALKDPQTRASAAAAELSGLRIRLDWLADRVSSLAPEHPESKEFVRYCNGLSVRLTGLTTFEWDMVATGPVTQIKFDEIQDAKRGVDKSIAVVFGMVRKFGSSTPLRNPRRQRVLIRMQDLRRQLPELVARVPMTIYRQPTSTDDCLESGDA